MTHAQQEDFVIGGAMTACGRYREAGARAVRSSVAAHVAGPVLARGDAPEERTMTRMLRVVLVVLLAPVPLLAFAGDQFSDLSNSLR